MKFGKRLKALAVPEWEASYVSYAYLKRRIKDVAKARGLSSGNDPAAAGGKLHGGPSSPDRSHQRQAAGRPDGPAGSGPFANRILTTTELLSPSQPPSAQSSPSAQASRRRPPLAQSGAGAGSGGKGARGAADPTPVVPSSTLSSPPPSSSVHLTLSLAGAGRAPKTDPVADLMREVDLEIDKVNQFSSAKMQEIINSFTQAAQLLATIDVSAAPAPSGTSASAAGVPVTRSRSSSSSEDGSDSAGPFAPLRASLRAVWKRLDVAGDLLCKLSGYISLNGLALEKAAKKADKVAQTCLLPWVRGRLPREPFMLLPITNLFVPLSELYTACRTRMEALDKREKDSAAAGAAGTAGAGVGAGAGAAGAAGSTWKPPSSFVRQTTKYWVPYSRVAVAKALIVKHLPVLVFGREESGDVPIKSLLDASKATGVSDGQMITSVYFDSDDLAYYQSRIRRDEGARLFRVRWYGPPQCPSSSKATVFVERKTHHESWVHADSVKERFSFPVSRMPRFLEGDATVVTTYLRHLVEEGSLTKDKAAKTAELAAEVQPVLSKLRAKVRSIYHRTAFQRSDRNDVRISLDTGLQLLREEPLDWTSSSPGTPLNPNEDPHAQGRFCAPDSALEDDRRSYHFPYAVLEVKLAGAEAPAWVPAMLEASNAVPVYKFSKFLSGISQLYRPDVSMCPHWFEPDGTLRTEDGAEATAEPGAEAAPTTVHLSPNTPPTSLAERIAGGPGQESARSGTGPVSSSRVGGPGSLKPKGGLQAGTSGTGPRTYRNRTRQLPPVRRLPDANMAEEALEFREFDSQRIATTPKQTGGLKPFFSEGSGSNLPVSDGHPKTNPPPAYLAGHPRPPPLTPPPRQPLAPSPTTASSGKALPVSAPHSPHAAWDSQHPSPEAGGPQRRTPDVGRAPRTDAGKLMADVEAGEASDPPSGSRGSPFKAALSSIGSRIRLLGKSKAERAGKGAPAHKRMVPVKIEPKTFFANERTFIQWLGASILLVTLAVALFSVDTHGARTTGAVFAVIAVIFLFYALGMFLWRAKMIRSKSSGPYDDLRGPIALVVVLVAALGLTALFTANDPNTSSSSSFSSTIVNLRALQFPISILPGVCDSAIHYPGAIPVSTASFPVPGLTRPSSAVYHPRLNSVLLASPYSFVSVPATWDEPDAANRGPASGREVVTYPVPGYDIEAIALVDPASDFVYLGVEFPENAILEYNLVTQTVVREFTMDRLGRINDVPVNVLEGLAFVPDAANPEGGTFWVTGLTDVLEVQLPLVSDPSSKESTIVGEVRIDVDLAFDLPEASRTAADLAYDPASSTMFVLFSRVAQLRAYQLPDWQPVGTWTLPGGFKGAALGARWEGVHVVDGGSAVLVALDTPAKLYRLPITRDGAVAAGAVGPIAACAP